MLPQVLRCGVSIFEYWEMTIGEMMDIIYAYKATSEYNQQRDYTLATMIASFVSCGLAGKQIPKYEQLFVVDKSEESHKTDAATMLYMEQWKDFADRRNKLLKEQNNYG